MAKPRTAQKNALKRRKRRLQRQLEEDVLRVLHEGQESRVEEAVETELMKNEENSQRVHETWLHATAIANASFAKKQRILEERKQLMESIKQQIEQEKMEQEAMEKDRQEAMESMRLERIEADSKKQSNMLQSLPLEKQREMTCSFFARTGTCRFGANCTRYHCPVPSSRFVLIKAMHSIQLAQEDELEVDDKLLQATYRDFYNDVLAECVKFGFVVQLTTCCNLAPHLRGNVYIEYQTPDQAAAAVHGLFGRFYAGKQLYPALVPMTSWAQSICGLYQQRRCIRGRDCNFLHPFRTPVEVTPSYPFRRPASPRTS
ncbi:U2 small nuclear ribonucleoprotein auxiliary factor 35 kDa subunit-related protein 1-like [Achlya hypogyna]|uniref:U2 small nuclear ribonucleoprotein auxiliary factor 35 kDa subunit-related protein 1-like n=1 Tax=Achlya hypogyna TaxID=1202772 RepID=A0A1V9Z8J7_ACHHY|nr:U2 small nuclear ribonucleoprotein auxiliary factor 35 kDa subunit-related protein 1-like [Achlya hypogyna]